MKNKKSQRGVSLYYAILIMSISLAVALGVNTIAVKSLQTSREIRKSPPALFGADTGIERALFDISNNNAGIGSSTTATLDLGSAGTVEYNYEIQGTFSDMCPDDSMYCIYSTGSYKGSQRTLKVVR